MSGTVQKICHFSITAITTVLYSVNGGSIPLSGSVDIYRAPELDYKFVEDVQSLVYCGAKTAIDIGCYEGEHSMLLSRLGLTVTGLDIRQRNISPPIDFICGDARDIDLFGTYDMALCHNFIYHLENPVDFLRKLKLTTGVVFLGTCISNKPRTILEGYEGMWMPQQVEDFWGSGDTPTFVFTEESLDKVMEDLGYNFRAEFSRREAGILTWILRRYDTIDYGSLA